MKKIVFVMVLAIAMFTLAACGDDEVEVEYPVDDYFNATVTGSEVDGDTVKLMIDGQGFYEMRVEVTFEAGEMTAFNVVEHQESADWGGNIIEAGELQASIVEHANNLNALDLAPYIEIDEEASATATVEALIDIASAAIEHFNEYYAD